MDADSSSDLNRIENALRDCEARNAAMLDSALDCIITMNSEGRVVEFNQAAERTFGYSREHAVGRTVAELIIPPETREAHWAGLAKAVETGHGPLFGRRVELQAMRADGRRIDVELAIALTRLAGQPSFFTAYVRDVTARKQADAALRESEQRYRTLVEQVKDYAIFQIDVGGRATTWNEGVRGVLGFEEHEFIGQDIVQAIFLPEDVRSGAAQKELNTAVSHGVASDDRWMTRKDGTPFFAFGVTTALRDAAGRLMGFTKVMRDMTERKRLEDALKEADRRKDEFIATLAHELRNPLAPIVNAAALLCQNPQADDRLRWSCEVIERQAKHMRRLLHDLLDVSRVSTGKIELRKEPVSLSEVIDSAMQASHALIQQRAHELETKLPAEPILLHADPVRLAQVFTNLLHNAAKYTSPGGRISLVAQRRGAEAVISVRDGGIGIAPEKLPHVFDLFFQIQTGMEREYGGLGIGLSLAKRLVELHGGGIEARSQGVGRGSEFIVRLPTGVLAQEAAAAVRETTGAPAPRRRLLVVDDNADAGESLAALLRMSNDEVKVVTSGEAALDMLESFRPDAMIIDIGMPGMTGHDVAKEIRARAAFRDIRLIALSGYGQQEDRKRSEEAGFDAHLVKPADVAKLGEIIAKAGARI